MQPVMLFALMVALTIAASISQGRAARAATDTVRSVVPGMPHLRRQGDALQLVVDDKPFLILGGETLNSSSSSRAYMKAVWQLMNDVHANTVLVPVTWELLEPEEGKYDFSQVEDLIRDARAHHLHLVLLWMASWKNGMSSYPPEWVKADYKKYPRVRRADGSPVEVLSTLSPNSRAADARAFAALMRHLKAFDGREHTVLMMQIENEVGILGDSRDRCPEANAAFGEHVPGELMDHLAAHDVDLVPEFRALWMAAGHKSSGTWEEVFGVGAATDEIFMAWNYARYVDAVAAAGKAEYPVPMYVNAWLNEGNAKPGDYPSGCPEAHLIDIWQAGAPQIDLLAPDLYAENFTERCQLYTRRGNPLFIPEMSTNEGGARNVFYAIGQHNAIGTSPFGIDHVTADSAIGQSYGSLRQVAPQILAHQGTGNLTGFVLDEQHPMVKCSMGGYELEISLDSIFGHTVTQGYGVVMTNGDGEFLGAGSGFRVAFRPKTPGPARAGIALVEEGVFEEGRWIPGRRLNGDETDQGWKWRFSRGGPKIEHCRVYRFE